MKTKTLLKEKKRSLWNNRGVLPKTPRTNLRNNLRAKKVAEAIRTLVRRRKLSSIRRRLRSL